MFAPNHWFFVTRWFVPGYWSPKELHRNSSAQSGCLSPFQATTGPFVMNGGRKMLLVCRPRKRRPCFAHGLAAISGAAYEKQFVNTVSWFPFSLLTSLLVIVSLCHVSLFGSSSGPGCFHFLVVSRWVSYVVRRNSWSFVTWRSTHSHKQIVRYRLIGQLSAMCWYSRPSDLTMHIVNALWRYHIVNCLCL